MRCKMHGSEPYPISHIAHRRSILVKLDFLHRNCIEITDLNATLATQAVIFIYRFGPAFNQLVNIHRTYVCAFTITCALFLVHRYFPHVLIPPCGLGPAIRKMPKVS